MAYYLEHLHLSIFWHPYIRLALVHNSCHLHFTIGSAPQSPNPLHPLHLHLFFVAALLMCDFGSAEWLDEGDLVLIAGASKAALIDRQQHQMKQPHQTGIRNRGLTKLLLT